MSPPIYDGRGARNHYTIGNHEWYRWIEIQYDYLGDIDRGSLELISSESYNVVRLVNENLDYRKIRSNQIVLGATSFCRDWVIKPL